MPASQDPDQRIFDRRRIVLGLLGLPFAAAALSLAGCADLRAPRPTRPRSHIHGGGNPNSDGGGVGGRR